MQNTQTILFYIFASILLLAALRVVTAKNPVHAVLFLVLAFFSAAATWLLVYAEFLAIILILVYVGAVMVLLLFVVMMLDQHLQKTANRFWQHVPLALLIGALIILQMLAAIWQGFAHAPFDNAATHLGTTAELGRVMYREYIYPIEIAGIILVLAMISAVALTHRKRKDVRYNDPAKAVATQRNDRIKLINMPAEVDKQVDTGDSSSEIKK